jgi:hypothetical protein
MAEHPHGSLSWGISFRVSDGFSALLPVWTWYEMDQFVGSFEKADGSGTCFEFLDRCPALNSRIEVFSIADKLGGSCLIEPDP